MTKRHRPLLVGGSIVLAAVLAGCHDSSNPATSAKQPDPDLPHVDVVLRDRLGDPMTVDTTEPYSPRQTCGGCHNIDKIANGYHFQQGRTNMQGEVIVKSDYFQDGRNYLLSPGMYGKW